MGMVSVLTHHLLVSAAMFADMRLPHKFAGGKE